MAVISQPKQEKIKLDLYDKKIIFYLSQNSRMPLTALAKKLKISLQRCKYKIERLKKEILEPGPLLTYPLLEIPSFIIYTPQLSKETVQKLFSNDSIFFLLQSIGKYQYIINIASQDILGFCSEYLANYHLEVYPVLNLYADDYNPFKLNISPKPLLPNKKISLDKKDYKILAHLGIHTTDSLLEIQKATGIDRQTVKARIKRFEESNIIQKFRYGINVFKMGFLAYILKIEVAPKNKKRVLECIRQNNYSGFVFESYTTFTMHFIPPTHNEVFEFIKQLEHIDPTVKIDVVQNTESYKVELVPKNVIKIFQSRGQ